MNIIDTLVIQPTDNDTFSTDDQVDIIGTIMQLMYDYVVENPVHIQNATFHNDMMESVEELICVNTLSDMITSGDDDTFDDMGELVNQAIDLFYMQIMPKRSTLLSDSNTNKVNESRTYRTRQVLTQLQVRPQPAQRTNEWYVYRHALITASNAYKIFDTLGSQNQLIYEKCSPLPVAVHTDTRHMNTQPQSMNDNSTTNSTTPVPTVNVSSPMHWGHKYEPLSAMYYEMIHGTTVGEYGCIQHSKYSFLGASPDGIVDNPTSDKYGQMLEIKNVVNRDITGIPLKAYWVQMQLQLEVCDLDECDFLETRFKEYADYPAFVEDCDPSKNGSDSCYTKTCDGKWKGVILYFIDAAGVPVYEYKPLEMGQEEYETVWESKCIHMHKQLGHTLMWPVYWWLEEVSCVLVERNRLWFSMVIDKISAFWDIILAERETGYAHRAPTKRKPKDDGFGQCLITIDGELKGISIHGTEDVVTSDIVSLIDEVGNGTLEGGHSPSDVQPPLNVVHIRTQSFDDTIIN